MDAAENMPQRIKLELRTLLEQFFLGGTLISPIFIFLGYQQMKIGDSPLLMLGAIAAFMLSLLLLFVTDNYYLLDLDKRALLYRFKFMFFERLSKVTDFSGVQAVSLDCDSGLAAKIYCKILREIFLSGNATTCQFCVKSDLALWSPTLPDCRLDLPRGLGYYLSKL